MSDLQKLTVLIKGIQSGRMNARWANNVYQYLIEHEEGVELILQYIQPQLSYIDVETFLPVWKGCCRAHPDLLPQFLAMLEKTDTPLNTLVVAGSGCQPISMKAVEAHLKKVGRAQEIELLTRKVARTAIKRAVYSEDASNLDADLLLELLERDGAQDWLAINEAERPLPWSALWAKCVDPADGVALKAIRVLDVMLEKDIRINDTSPDNAQCWALEDLCHRYASEPVAVGVLVEALLARGASHEGLEVGPLARAFLDERIQSV